MVSTKHVRLNIEMDIEIPVDLLENKDKVRVIEDGITKCLKGFIRRRNFISC
jgi:hypothetical protein